jgi:hypothetical protein
MKGNIMFTTIKQTRKFDRTGVREIGYDLEEAREVPWLGCFVRHTICIPRDERGLQIYKVNEVFVPGIKISTVGEVNELVALNQVIALKQDTPPPKKDTFPTNKKEYDKK